MVEPTDRLIQRVLLALLIEPRPMDWFGNALQRKALIHLRAQHMVRIRWNENPGGRLASLTGKGARLAKKIQERRAAAHARLAKRK